MRPPTPGFFSFKNLAAVAVVAIAYVVFAKIGFSLAFETRQVTAVWPPTGIALAALLLGGYRVWPGIFIGAFVSNSMTGEPLWAAGAIAFGNTLGPLAGAFSLRALQFDNRFERLRDVLAMAVCGAALPMVVTATNGVFWLAVAHIVPWNEFGHIWPRWWSGDTIGALLVAPLILTWATNRGTARDWRTIVEFAALAIGSAIFATLTFTSDQLRPYPNYPFIIWAALRFRQRETATIAVLMATIAVIGTSHGLGPFGQGELDYRLTLLLAFLAALAITGYILTAVRSEWRSAEQSLEIALEKSMRVAQKLQTAFLPKQLPHRKDVQLDALYLTARREALIGGDWYDAYELPDGRIVISIGDVTGHGLDAAATAARIRQGIIATAFDTPDPSIVLRKINRMMQFQDDSLASAIVAILDPGLATMRFASAGHPPPVVAGPTIAANAQPYGGAPLGAMSDSEYETYDVVLERDALVIFYTDGLLEFKREIYSAESSLLDAAAALVAAPVSSHPALAVQRAVMGSQSPLDDIVILTLQLSPVVARNLNGDSEFHQTWRFHSNDVYSAHAARHALIDFLGKHAARDSDLFQTELILGEMLSNTVEHAPGPVTVEVDWTSHHPVVTMLDSGPGFAVERPALPNDRLSESGRGLFLIASLASEMHVDSVPGVGTTLRVKLPVRRTHH